MKSLGITTCAVAVLIAPFGPAPEVCSCALAPRAGDVVYVAEESALIVWDAATRTQHFIRRAQFDSKARDFGFIVPTPARPELSEVGDAVFEELLRITRPPPREAPRAAAAKGDSRAIAVATAAPQVAVLETVTVAGLDATVLEANDAKALDRWLREHGYASSPELAAWFAPYIAAKWLFTAFKISKGDSRAERAQTSAVRMSFRTDRPFFPYREPATKGAARRALEIYFVSSERVEGAIGSAARPWPGATLWAKPLEASTRADLLERAKLPANAVPANAWLTRFLDESSPRPGTDELYFSRAKVQAEYMDASRLESELERKSRARNAALARWSPEVSELYGVGESLEKEGDLRGAIRYYRRAARAGHGQAAKRLGDIFRKGSRDVPRDYAESLYWYDTARQLGVPVEDTGKR